MALDRIYVKCILPKRRMEGRSVSESVLRPQIEHKYACIPHEGHNAGWKE